jgi:hypothetical protein
MIQEKDKSVLVHWYYSVSEWEEFVKKIQKNRQRDIVLESCLAWMLGTLILYFGVNMSLVLSMVISGNMAVIYGVTKYYIRTWLIKWKGDKMPEIIIADDTAIVNGKSTVFHGNGKLLRKVDVKENNNINIVEITFERQTRKGSAFEEITIPVPRGRLREAMELQDCLNLRRDVLSLFN